MMRGFRRFIPTASLLALALGTTQAFAEPETKAQPLAVDVFEAKEADVNALVFSDGIGTFVVDTTRNSKEAAQLLALARSKGQTPFLVLITHAHPDHFLGAGQMKKEIPGLRIAVAHPAMKGEMAWLADFLDGLGMLEQEPGMKPKSEKYPNGFDYDKEIEVWTEPVVRMPGGAVLELRSDYPPSEAAHITTLFSKDLNAFFAGDLAYEGTHLWLGGGVTPEAVENWKRISTELEAKYGPTKTRIYPGHGKPTDVSIFPANRRYIDTFFGVVKQATSLEDARSRMLAAYPEYKDADFLMMESLKAQLGAKLQQK